MLLLLAFHGSGRALTALTITAYIMQLFSHLVLVLFLVPQVQPTAAHPAPEVDAALAPLSSVRQILANGTFIENLHIRPNWALTHQFIQYQ